MSRYGTVASIATAAERDPPRSWMAPPRGAACCVMFSLLRLSALLLLCLCISVFFCVGQPLEHEQWGHCLVYGWEARCGAIPLGSVPEGIVDNRLYFAGIDSGVSREQPFYRVLLADGTARFVAQERLRAVGRRAGLQHPVRGSSFFFVSADASAGRYLANTHLASRFPEDFELGLSA